MWTSLIITFLCPTVVHTFPVKGVPASFDCAMRKAAYAYGQKLLPRLGAFEPLYYALNLNSDECHQALAGTRASDSAPSNHASIPPDAIYVAPAASEHGTDGNGADGSIKRPFTSIQVAADKAAAQPTGSRTVVLRGGTFYLSASIILTARHSGLRFVAHPGESPVVSGGKRLSLKWSPHRVHGSSAEAQSHASNIWVADVSGQVSEIPGLQIDGARATRARYPNLAGGIEVSPGYGSMISSRSAAWTPPDFNKYGKVDFYTDANASHARSNAGWFENYMIGSNGLCSVYDPPVSYWCSQHPSGGGAFAFRTPSGVTPKPGVLPNAPYDDPSDALLFVWRPYRWANWMLCVRLGIHTPSLLLSAITRSTFDSRPDSELGSYNATTNNISFGRGGNQGARGENYGGDWFIENVFEELVSAIGMRTRSIDAALFSPLPTSPPLPSLARSPRPSPRLASPRLPSPRLVFPARRVASSPRFVRLLGLPCADRTLPGSTSMIARVASSTSTTTVDALRTLGTDRHALIAVLLFLRPAYLSPLVPWSTYPPTAGTGAPPASATIVAPQLRTLVNMSGTQWDPVKNVVHTGIAFRATRYTYMDPHGVPSAGDWALDRVGAIFLQGTVVRVLPFRSHGLSPPDPRPFPQPIPRPTDPNVCGQPVSQGVCPTDPKGGACPGPLCLAHERRRAPRTFACAFCALAPCTFLHCACLGSSFTSIPSTCRSHRAPSLTAARLSALMATA